MKANQVTRCLRCRNLLGVDESLLCFDCEEGGTYDC
jgi:hypothetical protein